MFTLRSLPALLLVVLAIPAASALALPEVGLHVELVAEGAGLAEPPAERIATPGLAIGAPAGVARADARVSAGSIFPSLDEDAPRAIAAFVGADARVPATEPSDPAERKEATIATAAAGSTTLLWILIERFGLGRVFTVAFAALYSRLKPSQLVEHERRERVVALVRERPGIGPQDVANALGTGWGVTVYHLDKLERAGLVTSQRVGHHRCYFLPGAIPRDQQHGVALVRGDTTRRVAALIAEKPGLTQTQAAGELGLSASAMSKQVARLEQGGLLRRESAAGGAKLYPAAPMVGALAPAAG